VYIQTKQVISLTKNRTIHIQQKTKVKRNLQKQRR
jgi:hypothetical protein